MVATKQKKRGQVSRSRAKLILIGAEGRNKTEKIYFNELFRNRNDYRVRFTSSTETDPVGIVEATARFVKSEDLDFKNGDLAFCAVDTDTDLSKQDQIDRAVRLAEKNNIELLLSNPCFEVWFLQHFRYSTKSYMSNDEVLRELAGYIPDYKKSSNVYGLIESSQEQAIKHAKQLESHHANLGKKKGSMTCNPSTDAYKVLEV